MRQNEAACASKGYIGTIPVKPGFRLAASLGSQLTPLSFLLQQVEPARSVVLVRTTFSILGWT